MPTRKNSKKAETILDADYIRASGAKNYRSSCNNTQIKEKARKQIDAADQKLFSLLSKFQIAAEFEATCPNVPGRDDLIFPGSVEMWRNNAPRSLLRLVANHLDLNCIDIEKACLNILEIAQALSERFYALEGVIQAKKAEGEIDSYDEERHNLVIHRGAQGVANSGGNYDLGERVFKTIADEFVRMQNQYLQQEGGPIADYLKEKNIASKQSRSPGW